MKNWIVALFILIIPMVVYLILDKTNNSKTAFEAQASYAKPVVIKFASPMCLDCKKLEGTINEIMPKYTDNITYEKISIQSNDKKTSSMIKKYNVTLVPTMIFVKRDGTIYKRTEGYMTTEELEKIIKGLING